MKQDPSILRQRADKIFKDRPYVNNEQLLDNVSLLVEEYHICMIELELQNEELRAAHLRVEETLKKYTDLYDFAPIGYLTIDKHGFIINANLNVAKMLTTARENVIGTKITKFIDYDHQDIFYRHKIELIRTGKKIECELIMQTAAGQRFYAMLNSEIEVQSANDSYQIRIAITDSSESHHLTQQLLEAKSKAEKMVDERTADLHISNTRLTRESGDHEQTIQRLKLFRNLIDHSNDAIIAIDPATGRFIDFNLRANQLLGYSQQELAALTIQDIQAEIIDELAWNRFAEDVKVNGSMVFESMHKHKDGALTPVEVSIRFIAGATGDYFIEVVRDMTEIHGLREQKYRTKRMAVLGEFSASVAHEIRNPLAALELRLDSLARELAITSKNNSNYAHILAAMECMKQIVDKILNFAKPLRPEFRNVNIHAIIDNSLALLPAKVAQAEFSIVKAYCRETLNVFIDHSHFHQIFVNLIANALEAMADGGKLIITTREERLCAIVEIADTGNGIPPDQIDHIFEAFFTTRHDGTGLGLAIVARLIESNHAKIQVASTVGKGTIFTLSIPRTEDSES